MIWFNPAYIEKVKTNTKKVKTKTKKKLKQTQNNSI